MSSGNQRSTMGIVIPVFNDWYSLERLIRELEEHAKGLKFNFQIFIVDDSSPEGLNPDCLLLRDRYCSLKLHLIRLSCNLGHQRAIAVGLVAASRAKKIEAVVVMDADGEDQPEDVPRLIAAWSEDPKR